MPDVPQVPGDQPPVEPAAPAAPVPPSAPTVAIPPTPDPTQVAAGTGMAQGPAGAAAAAATTAMPAVDPGASPSGVSGAASGGATAAASGGASGAASGGGNRTALIAVLAGVIVVLLGAIGALVLWPSAEPTAASASTTVAGTGTETSSTKPTSAEPASDAAATTAASRTTTTPTSATTSASTSASSSGGPTITAFSVSPSSAKCVSGQMSPKLTAKWTTNGNVTKVDVANNGNFQGSGGADGSFSFYSICGETNKVTIVAHGSGAATATAARSVVVSQASSPSSAPADGTCADHPYTCTSKT